MESIAATIITKFIVHCTSTGLSQKIDHGELRSLEPDLNHAKMQIVAQVLNDEYHDVIKTVEADQGANSALEWPLLKRLLDKLLSEPNRIIDDGYRDFLNQLKTILSRFDRLANTATPPANLLGGSLLREVYQEFHLAGPFIVSKKDEKVLTELIREIEVTFPDKVLFSIVHSPTFLSTAAGRKFDQYGLEPVGENVLVPATPPPTWDMGSTGCVPLHLCDFSMFNSDTFRVILMDPWRGAHISGKYVLDVFRNKCKILGIKLHESERHV
jgi:hypothetical protein